MPLVKEKEQSGFCIKKQVCHSRNHVDLSTSVVKVEDNKAKKHIYIYVCVWGVLYCIVLYYIILYYIILYYIYTYIYMTVQVVTYIYMTVQVVFVYFIFQLKMTRFPYNIFFQDVRRFLTIHGANSHAQLFFCVARCLHMDQPR